MSQHIRNLIRQGEHQQLDFKYAVNDSKKIARSLVAFANTEGGTLLIGVKDNGAIAGAEPEEEFYMVQAASQMYSKPEVYFESKMWNIDKKVVLEIIVPKSENKPHRAPNENGEWKTYIRVEDKNILANIILLRVWDKQKKQYPAIINYSEKEKILFRYLFENKNITLTKFSNIALIPRKKAEHILVNLIISDIIKMYFAENGIFYQFNPELKNKEKLLR